MLVVGVNVNSADVPLVENLYSRQREKPPTLIEWTFHRLDPICLVADAKRRRFDAGGSNPRLAR